MSDSHYGSKERVTAIASCYDNADLIPHWLDHHKRLGVDQLIVLARRPEMYDPALLAARQVEGARAIYSPSDFFADSDRAKVEADYLSLYAQNQDEWVMHLDLDEFQQFPAPLSEVVKEMNRANDWALRGWIVDRVAEGGFLAKVQPSPTIFEQCPIRCDITEKLLGAWTQKIMLCRRRVRLKGWVRHDTENAHYDRVPIGRGWEYVVHHFKWLAGLDERLKKRLAEAGTSEKYKTECRVFLDHYKRNAGRINLNDPRFNARREGAFVYPSAVVRG